MMDLGFLALKLPLAGVFDALRVMWLEHFWLRGQFSISDTMFPSLQELTIRMVRGLTVLTLDSKSLMYIRLSFLLEIQRLNILAPGLNTLEVTLCFYNELEPVATIAAERLKVLRWEVPCVPELTKIPRLHVLGAPPITTLWSEDICAKFLNCFPAANHLELQISPAHLFKFRVQNSCLPGSICNDEPGLWGADVVELRALEKVEIFNFHGASGEVYFVEQLVLRAPMLKLLRVTSKVEDDSLDNIEGIRPPGCRFEIVVVRDRSKKE